MKIEQEYFDAMTDNIMCKFWNNGNEIIGLITAISKEGQPFRADNGYWYMNCEPIRTQLLKEKERKVTRYDALHELKSALYC